MKQKLEELSEILKTNSAIKERWAGEITEIFWCSYNKAKRTLQTPAYHDVLECLGEDYYLNKDAILKYKNFTENTYCIEPIFYLSPWPLSSQSDETLDEIILLCKIESAKEKYNITL